MSTPARADPRRWWALVALVAANLVLSFDTTILNVALPSMSAQLGAGSGQLQWIANSYIVVFAALMLPAGLLGDRFGRRRMLVCGLGVFLAGSLLGTLAHTAELVIAARTVMGAGAALIMPLALAALPSLFAPEERTRVLGAISAVSALGLPLGPLVGGWLLKHFWWGSVFFINVPLVLIGIAACVFLLPETRDPASPRIDAVSTLLTVTGLGALIFGLNEGPARGWASPLIAGAFLASLALLAALVWRGRGQSRPMLDVSLLRERAILWSTAAATLISLVLAGLMFVLPQYLQGVLGYDTLGAGLGMLPLMAGMVIASKATGAITARLGARAVITGGLLALSAAAFLGSTTGAGDGYGITALWLAVAGLGIGAAVVPAMGTALGSLHGERAGSGSGLLTTVRQFGGAVGVALLGSLLAGAYTARLDPGGLPAADAGAAAESVGAARAVAERLGAEHLAASADSAFLHGQSLVLTVSGTAALAVALLVAARLPTPARRNTEQ
ncbi:MFS transporter [Streptomyces sp. HU2014]|uniref:MFS transporter n=1 Tax=Streptomyces sp. HU2014 TaxID=2939414 RepID=UPI00200DD2FD|nr:MFS transporter [Streptomyces sp. HU2014]UQI46097.1 MFS transporter [Streptomyces sp. HU2014]